MIINDDILRRDTIALLRLIDAQIEEVETQARKLGIFPRQMQDSSGNWPMIPLLLAKAQAYSTLVMLQAK